MNMDPVYRLGERFPWLDTVEKIAADQGFFHWELRFASVFADGGFDLQVGNPPWVRPLGRKTLSLLSSTVVRVAEKPPVPCTTAKGRAAVSRRLHGVFYIGELTNHAGMTFFGSNGHL